jgi:hypothetical protein
MEAEWESGAVRVPDTLRSVREDLRASKRLTRGLRRSVQVLRHRLIATRLKSTSTPLDDKAFSCNIVGVVAQLKHLCTYADDKCWANGKQNALVLATDVLANLVRNVEKKSKKGMRYNPRTKVFLAALRALHSREGFEFVSGNLGGISCERSARNFLARPDKPFMIQLTDSDFEYIADVYRAVKARLGITTLCAVSAAEDETAVQMRVGLDTVSDMVCGYCGCLCTARCDTIVECRKKRCDDPHSCMLDGLMIPAGAGNVGYENLVKKHEAAKVGREGRLIMLNPSDRRLPQLPALWVPTCKTVTSFGYLARQWKLMDELYKKHIEPVLGPLVSRGSDGDSTRRKQFLHFSLGTQGPRWALDGAGGFVYSGRAAYDDHRVLIEVVLRMDADYLHCIKKIINVSDGGRVLVMGDFVVKLSQIDVITKFCHTSEHLLHPTDHARKGYDAMDVQSCIRLVSSKVQVCLGDCMSGFATSVLRPERCVPQPHVRGIQAYLATVRRFAEIFLSRALAHGERVKSAGYVVTFYRLWRLWIVNCRPDLTLEDAFITREGRVDCALACHFAVLWLKVHREMFPGQDPNLDRQGTDVCEKTFSQLGGFIANRRIYTFTEALQTLRSFVSSEVAYAMGVERATKARRKTPPWKEVPDDDARNGSQVHIPDDATMAVLWNEGCDEARVECAALGMKPAGATPHWWLHPHEYDPRDGGHSNNEEAGDGDDSDDANEEDDTSSADDSDSEGGGSGQAAQVSDEGEGDDEEDGALDAVEAVVAAEFLDAPRKFATKLPVPGCGDVHKARIVKWLAGEVPTLSADRSKKVSQAYAAAGQHNAAPAFDLSVHDWWVGDGDDIAVLCDGGYWIGRVTMMKRRFQSKTKKGKVRYIQYKNKVQIDEGRDQLGDLLFHLHWYKATKHRVGRANVQETRYTFTVKDTEAVELKNLICPCAMAYNVDGDYFTISAETTAVSRDTNTLSTELLQHTHA